MNLPGNALRQIPETENAGQTKPNQTHSELLHDLIDQATPWLEPKALSSFRHDWQLNNDQQDKAKEPSPVTGREPSSEQGFALRLLQALHPQLHPNAPGSTVERETRCQQFIAIHKQRYRLLNTEEEASPYPSPS